MNTGTTPGVNIRLEHEPGEDVARFVRDIQGPEGADPRWLAVLRQALRHQTMALVARDHAKQVTGYLPLAIVSSRLFGRYLVSLPYVNQAGPVARDPAIAAALLEAAVGLARARRVQYLELREGADSPVADHRAITDVSDQKVRMVMDLPGDADALWQAIPSKVRNQVRKGDKHGLSIRFGRDRTAVEAFYSVFAVNMRDLGTPVYPRKLFACICDTFAEQAELVVVSYQGIAVAGALLMHEGERSGLPGVTRVPSASCLRPFNHTNANMWMYHQLLVRAVERGSASFDFGRSSEGSGTYRFKRQWGATPVSTAWRYVRLSGGLDSVRPDNPRYQRKIAAWQKLPVWVTKVIGPPIVRGIP